MTRKSMIDLIACSVVLICAAVVIVTLLWIIILVFVDVVGLGSLIIAICGSGVLLWALLRVSGSS